MKKFFSNNGILILAAVTLIAVIMCIASAFSGGTGFLHNAAGVIASPFRAAGAAVTRWSDGITDRFSSVEELQKENSDLRRQIASLEQSVRQAQTDSEENARLRSLLDLRQQRRDFVFESAYITERSVSNWASTLTLGKGTSCGIAEGNCVVDSEGYLVGIVTEAGLNWCTVATVLDTDAQIGAKVFRTGETTVAMGDLSLMSRNRLKLNYLEGESSLINGDLVVTSGLGGYYPSGIVIGSVEEILTDDGGLTKYAILTPQVELSELSEVFVITAFDVVD